MKTVFIFISFLLLVACSNKNAELAKKHNDEGVLFLDKEEYDKASESFHTALGQGKINVELEAGILRNLSLLHSFQDHKDSAMIYVEKAMNKAEKDSYYYFLTKAEFALLNENVEAAISNFEKAKGEKPDEMAIYNSLGMIYSGKCGVKFEDQQKALINNKKAYELSQREPLADALATSYMNVNKYKESIPLWESLIKQNPSKMDYHFQLGVAFLFSGQQEKGEEKMEFAAERDENCQRMLDEMIAE
jgi:tetratricopeptide (TPR) repeat protein